MLSDSEVFKKVDTLLSDLSPMRRVLLLAPDATRSSSFAGEIASYIYHKLIDRTDVHLTPTVGTHEPDEKDWRSIREMYRDIPESAYKLHEHDEVAGLYDLGVLPDDEILRISGGEFAAPVPVQVNRNLVEGNYDQVFSIGQVVPHEVMGFANYDKNVFIGAGGKNFIDTSHWISALCGIDNVLGKIDSAPRQLLDAASALAKRDPRFPSVHYLLTVRGQSSAGDIGTHDFFCGTSKETFYRAAKLSLRENCHASNQPYQQVIVRLNEKKYRSFWLSNKAIYRTRRAIATGGTIHVIAPGLDRLGENEIQSKLIGKYGYCGTQGVKQILQIDPEMQANVGVAAHLIHGSTENRFHVRYYTHHSSELLSACRFADGQLGYSLEDIETAHERFSELTVGESFNADQRRLVIDDPGLGLWITKASP
ncbi:lactate racemase domain-containing protein [Adhaeretor mobilis]|uniref:LarA-like N-terminal domain-containing protein n=1 Tax=Adhaeretor mobilis TaxID=1930276 RepID=A0A517MQN9_9BACT|nr:lactate racemase domain-containing protein [Adhaeretor mobilis]QDS97199.1 hypothetical protein HG15A2_04590 [Adhaeretor mobilis]